MKKLIPLLLAVLLLTGCMGGSKLSLRIEHDPVADVYGFADIEVTANQDAKFQFVANGGEIIHATGVSDIVAYVYEAALEDGTVLRLYEQ